MQERIIVASEVKYLPTKNGDLVVNGVVTNSFVPEFHNVDELRNFEWDAYVAYDETYGKGACDRDGIEHLSDLFGKEFADRILCRRFKLVAMKKLAEVRIELIEMQNTIQRYEQFIENPKPKWPPE